MRHIENWIVTDFCVNTFHTASRFVRHHLLSFLKTTESCISIPPQIQLAAIKSNNPSARNSGQYRIGLAVFSIRRNVKTIFHLKSP